MKTQFGEFRILTIRETSPDCIADQPAKVAAYWKEFIADEIDHDKEHFIVLLLNTRCRITGHSIVSMGVLDQVVVHPREVFRPAIIGAAHSIVMIHNHPSGDPSPSEADIRLTRELVQAGKIMRIHVMDHIIIGSEAIHSKGFVSLREMGYVNL